MEVGIKIGPADGPEVKDAAVRAEALGFDSVWLSERVAIPLDKPHPYEPGTDPWIGLAFVARRHRARPIGHKRQSDRLAPTPPHDPPAPAPRPAASAGRPPGWPRGSWAARAPRRASGAPPATETASSP